MLFHLIAFQFKSLERICFFSYNGTKVYFSINMFIHLGIIKVESVFAAGKKWCWTWYRDGLSDMWSSLWSFRPIVDIFLIKLWGSESFYVSFTPFCSIRIPLLRRPCCDLLINQQTISVCCSLLSSSQADEAAHTHAVNGCYKVLW